YAIDLVEKVKHLFSVENVVFILVMNQAQLERSVSCVYGQGIDARTYLQKFINLEIPLPKNLKSEIGNDYKKYCNLLGERHGLRPYDEDYLIKTIALLAKHFEVSLRGLERVFALMVIFFSSIDNDKKQSKFAPEVLAFLLFVKLKNPQLYLKLKKGESSSGEVKGFLDFESKLEINQTEAFDLQEVSKCVQVFAASEKEWRAFPEEEKDKAYFVRYRYIIHRSRTALIPNYCELLDLAKLGVS
ncbi:MAG: hypothetical protein KDK66_07490, partial [Deltaproteobacteria bacterium]|nr:hypothetical protein [Deltaproteobacteria bacterium]